MENITEFWITNISYLKGPRFKCNVLLNDLQILIRPSESKNLLDSKHYSYTLEQLLKSAESGSLYKKRDKIIIRKVAPKVSIKPGVYIVDAPNMVKPLRSQLEIVEPKYEELETSAEEMANDITGEEE